MSFGIVRDHGGKDRSCERGGMRQYVPRPTTITTVPVPEVPSSRSSQFQVEDRRTGPLVTSTWNLKLLTLPEALMDTPTKHPILVVDDEEEILFSLRGLLRQEFELHTAESGAESCSTSCDGT